MKLAVIASSMLCLLFWSACQNPSAEAPVPAAPPVDTVVGAEDFPTLNNQIKESPNNPELYIKRAELLLAEGEPEQALADINRALSIDSMVADFHVFKGEVYYSMLQTREARDELNVAISLDAENIEAHLKLAEIFLMLRMTEECFDNINNALRIDIYNARAYFLKGLNYVELQDTLTALSSFQTAIEQNPDYYEAYMLMANLLAAKHDPVAADYYTNALQIVPTSLEAFYGRAIFRQEHGQPEKAEVDYLAMLHLDSLNFNAWFNLGYVNLVHLKRYEVAIQHFDQALKLNPGSKDAWYNRGYCHELTDQLEKAEGCYRTALKLDPEYDLAANGISRIVDGDYRP